MKRNRAISCILCVALLAACFWGSKRTLESVDKENIDNRVLIEYYAPEKVYVADLNGNIVGKYDIVDIKKIFVENKSSFMPTHLKLEYDGILYYYCHEESGDQDEISAYYAVNPVTREISELFRIGKDEWLKTFDYYNGFIYSAVLVENNDSERTYKVYRIAKEKDELKFSVIEDDSLKVFYDTITDYSWVEDRKRGQYYECYEKMLGQQGFVVCKKNGEFYKIDAQGNTEIIISLSDRTILTQGYDDKCMLFSIMKRYSADVIGYYYYDFVQKKIHGIDIDLSDAIIKAMDKGTLYYTLMETIEYGFFSVSLHSYNLESGEDKVIISRESIPGAGNYSPLSSLIIENGKLFFEDYKGQKIGWYMADMEDADNTIVELALEPEHIDTFDYGTVEYTSVTSCCPHCGFELDDLYCETFQLDYRYSEYADVINKALYAHTNKKAEWTRNANVDNSSENCDEHDEWSQVTTENYDVSKVSIFNDRYLTVYESGYWYGGGAHGMPSREQYLFDLQTGEELTLKDFFKGTEDEFKTLIATKVKEEYERYEADHDSIEGVPYYARDSATAYESAYDYVNYNNVYFEENGIIYYFYPYELGSYADGFREIFVSYEEVFGGNTLGG